MKAAILLFPVSLLLAQLVHGQSTERASIAPANLNANGTSNEASLSYDGRWIAFESNAGNLVTSFTAGRWHIFVRDRNTGLNSLVSTSSSGVHANGVSGLPAVSGDGRFIAFQSYADNLVPGDTNGQSDVFVKNRISGQTERVSVSSLGVEGNAGSFHPSISADGRYVSFSSYADNLVANDFNEEEDVFRYDRWTGQLIRVSVSLSGGDANFPSKMSSISADGRYVAFDSMATNLTVGNAGQQDIFVRDCELGVTEQISLGLLGAQPDTHSFRPSMSANARFIAFESNASNLVTGDTNGETDIFVYDRWLGLTQRVSVSSFGEQAVGRCEDAFISGDGEVVTFHSFSENLITHGDTGQRHVFVHDLVDRTTERVSQSTEGEAGNDWSRRSVLSWDGSQVAFQSVATNLVDNDTNGEADVFVHTRRNGKGTNSIWLDGPGSASVGDQVTLSWFQAPPSSLFGLAYSLSDSGVQYLGHDLDLGTPLKVIHTGVASAHGSGSFLSPPLPGAISGLRIYLEVICQDSLGVIFDSQAHALDVL